MAFVKFYTLSGAKLRKKMHLCKFLRHKCIIFFILSPKLTLFATFLLVFMALNLICFVLHKPLLFPLFTHSSCFSLVPEVFPGRENRPPLKKVISLLTLPL